MSPDGILLASGAIDGIIAVFEVQVSASPCPLHTKRGRDESGRYVGAIDPRMQSSGSYFQLRFVCGRMLLL